MKGKNWTDGMAKVCLFSGVLFLPLAMERVHAATVPDIRGTWTEGPFSQSTIGCQDPVDNGHGSDEAGKFYDITNQTGANFSFTHVKTVFDQGRGEIGSISTCSGTVSSDGTVGASCTLEVTLNGVFWYSGKYTLTGSLVGNTLTYNLNGQDLVGDTCQWTRTGTDTRSGPIPPPIVLPITTPSDLDGDGKADLVWRNTSSGVVAGWLMDGITIASVGFPAGVPAEWQIEGIGDVNGDGKADVVWQNQTNGVVTGWLMNGLSITSVGVSGNAGPFWDIKGLGDFNGDGKADLLWRYAVVGNPPPSTGHTAIWLMNGTTITSVGFPASVPLEWQIAGIGDVNDDRKADVVWQNTTNGAVAVWLMNGLSIGSVVFVGGTSTDWQIKGVGDFNGDGKADILWQNQNDLVVAIWLLDGGAVASTVILSGVPSEWQIEQVADVNGDGKADVIWQNTNSGTVAVWLMNGTAIDSVGFPASIPSEWEIQP